MADAPELAIDDVKAVVRLLGRVALSTSADLVQRRRELMNGLCPLVGCDAWVWVHSRFDSSTGQAMVFSTLDGGFADEANRLAYFRAALDPDVQRLTSPPALEALQSAREGHVTIGREVFLPDPLLDEPALRAFTAASNYLPAIWSLYRLSEDTISAIGLVRRGRRDCPTPRQRHIAHLVLREIDWLHRAGTDVPANSTHLLRLSGRQREVLFLLVAGDSVKELARKLNISVHTAGDHVKSVYRVMGVRSRAALASKFIAGRLPRTTPEPADADAVA